MDASASAQLAAAGAAAQHRLAAQQGGGGAGGEAVWVARSVERQNKVPLAAKALFCAAGF